MIKNYESFEQVITDLKENPIEEGGEVYHPIPFSEFESLTVSSNAEEVSKKLKLIFDEVKTNSKKTINDVTALDVGANAGLYTFTFAKAGAKVVCFEPNERYSAIGQFIVKNKDLSVVWYPHEFKTEDIKGKFFDCALILSVFQWMSYGGDDRMQKARENLKYISKVSKLLFFELGFNAGGACLKTSKLNHYAALIKFLKENTFYNYFKLLGKTKLWRRNTRFLVLCSNEPTLDDNFLRRFIRSINI